MARHSFYRDLIKGRVTIESQPVDDAYRESVDPKAIAGFLDFTVLALRRLCGEDDDGRQQ
jgi:hypothetical protein